MFPRLCHYPNRQIYFHLAVTTGEIVSGFLLGSVLGFLFGYPLARSALLRKALMPYVLFAQTAPKIALIPLFVLWFGLGWASKLILIVSMVFFPVMASVILVRHLCDQTPAQALAAGRGPGLSEADMRRLDLLMLRREVKTISKDGFRLNGRLYWHEALASRRHPIVVAYDDVNEPHDVKVYDLDGNLICTALDREFYRIAADVQDKYYTWDNCC